MFFNLQEFDFPWSTLRVVLEGQSILDLGSLQIRSFEEATLFIKAYGFDPGNDEDLNKLWAFFEEATDFINLFLKPVELGVMPEHLKTREAIGDIRRLLLIASLASDHPDQKWGCAVLKVMHALIHLAYDPRIDYFEQAQNHILGRLDQVIFTSEKDGATYLGTPQGESVKLLYFKKKEKKDREREIVKLLHKADIIAEDIFDRIGYRLVTETKIEALKALKILIQNNIISVPHIRPKRSRNKLIDLRRVEEEIARARKSFTSDQNLKQSDIEKFFKRLERKIGLRKGFSSAENLFSSEHYKSIQFTCRELIRVNKSVQARSHEQQMGVKPFLNLPTLDAGSNYTFVFFPFEVQIMDVKSYADSIFGKSNHDEYKKKQVEAAKKRVFNVK